MLMGTNTSQPEAPPPLQRDGMDDGAVALPKAAAAAFSGPDPTEDSHAVGMMMMTTTTMSQQPSTLPSPPLRSHVALLAGLVKLQHQNRCRVDDTASPVPTGKRSRRSSKLLPHDYIWRWWCHSYSNQERWYATQMLLQDFLNCRADNSESEEAFYVRRWVFLRRLVASIMGRATNHPIRPLPQEGQRQRPNLTEWCATWQFVLGLRYDATAPTTTTNVVQEQNELVAVVYHHWPWFCETLWNFVLWSSSPDYDHSSILSLVRMMYSWTIATEDTARLPLVQTLHQCCLWSTKGLLRAHDDDAVTTTEDNDDPWRLSPLAHLIATHCRMQDHHHRPAAAIEAQQLLSDMIHYRTTVRVWKKPTGGGAAASDPTLTTTRTNNNHHKDDATSASVKTTKAGNAARTVPDDPSQRRGVASGTSSSINRRRRLEKEIMIRFAQDDDDDHVAPPSQRHNDDYDVVMDDLQSILLQSDHSSEDEDDDDDNHDGDSQDEDEDDDHTIFDEDDNETVSSKTKTNDTTIQPKEEDQAKSAKRPAASTDDATKSSKRTRVTTICSHEEEEEDVPYFERLVFGNDTYGKDKDDGDVEEDDEDDDDDDDDFIEDDDDDDHDGAMDYVELDPFISDDSLHRYRTTISERQKEKHDEEGDGDTELVVNNSTATFTSRVETSGRTLNPKDSTSTGSKNALSLESDDSSCRIEKRKLYILASMQVLMTLQHPEPKVPSNTIATIPTVDNAPTLSVSKKYLSITSENELIGSINMVVKPPVKPVVTRIVLRRAPTQEEFFRGSLTRNPVPVNMLLNNGSGNTANSTKNRGDTTANSDQEPTIHDLRQYIANDLQMSDSAELIEIIVANKILDVNLKIRVVQQVLWKKSLIEHPNSSSRDRRHESTLGSLTGFFASGSAMSFLLSSGVGGTISSHARGGSSGRVTADTPLAQLPPMIATYRLAGVDGEATEETVGVSDLIDPEAVSDTASPEEKDAVLEAEFGMTRYVATGRGVQALLRSTQDFVNDLLRRIRRDSIDGQEWPNPSRLELKQSPPCQALILLRYCAKLAINRKSMLEARAPTILLALLIDILKTLEDTSMSATTPKSNDSNPTTEILQELIELLTSDISSVSAGSKHEALSPTIGDVDFIDSNPNTSKDASSMSLLLQSIEAIALSSPLRIVVAKLLPFLTYGQPDLCRELAAHFDKHINSDTLIDWEKVGNDGDDGEMDGITKNSILTNTFIQTALVLPANDVCDGLRIELINCGFIERIVTFITQDVPNNPTPWTPALWPVGELAERKESLSSAALDDAWRNYYNRPGVRTAFKVLNGLASCHEPTQSRIAGQDNFIRVSHWLESTSDSVSVATNGLGLLAETLLDEITLGNDEVTRGVKAVRNITRLRKKELAQEQRNRALQKITSFGGINNFDSSNKLSKAQTAPSNLRQGFASILAPVVGLLQATSDSIISRNAKTGNKSSSENNMPSWMSEVEEMQDEVGLTCAVCQEGCTLQPSELLGLYVYIKKVSVSIDHGGSCSAIDGTHLFEALPSTLPESILEDTQSAIISEWFATTQSVVVNVLAGKTSKLSSSSSRHRPHVSYTTSVTAGNGIHYSCHRRARQADRSHPKAPKSEWEGATLRNSRVNCNAILPVVHGPNQSKISLSTMESALSDHSEIVSNLTGSSHKSALWSVLHDIRLLLLRISYNESLNSDCGGGSLASNCQLIYHQIYLARMRDRNAAMDRFDKQAEHSVHAHGLSAGVLLATSLINSSIATTTDSDTINLSVLTRHLADAASMGALTAVVFPDDAKDKPSASTTNTTGGTDVPTLFLQMLVVCAGRRHARGLTGSGCTSSRPTMEDDDGEDDNGEENDDTEKEEEEDPEESAEDVGPAGRGIHPNQALSQRRRASSKSTLVCDDFRLPLRPWLIYYLMLQQIQMDLTASSSSSEDGTLCDVELCGERLVTLVTTWWGRTVAELLAQLNQVVVVTEATVLDWFQRGMMSS